MRAAARAWIQRYIRVVERMIHGNLTTHLALTYRSLTSLYNAGIHIRRALFVLSEQCEHPHLKAALRDCVIKVEEGRRLSDGMARHADVFPLLHSNMIALGEQTGSMHLILDRIARQTEKANELRQQLRSALSYPLVIFGISVIVLVGAPAFVFKDLLRLLTELGVELPWTTRLMIGTSKLVSSPWMLLILALSGAAGALFFHQVRTNHGLRRKWEAFLLSLPIVGPALTATLVCDFTRSLASCYATGIPILKGLDLSARSTDNLVFHDKVAISVARMKEGDDLHKALSAAEFFPTLMLTMVSVGEESGRMAEMLDRTARMAEDEVQHTLTIATAALQPLMLLVIGFSVGFVVIATMSPMLKVIEAF